MDASRARVIGAAGVGIVVAVAAVLWVTREAPPIAREGDAAVEASADASADASASAEPQGSAVAATREAGIEAVGRADGGGVAAEAGVREARTVTLDEGGDGKTIELAKGQSVVLMLTASPTSGFDWAVIKAPAALGSPSMGFVSGGDQMGASGKRRIAWTLKDALPAGEHAVELGYQRSFEKGVAPFKTFRFKVRGAR